MPVKMRVTRKIHKWSCLFSLSLVLGLSFGTATVFAQQYTSPNYGVDELFIGSGGTNDASSASYKGRVSIGDLGVGNSVGTAYQSYGGFTTTAAPELEMSVPVTNLDLGTLSTASATTTSATFQVRTYLANSYVVYTVGAPPTNESGSQLTALTGGGTSSPGSEQFGINLVANTSPSVGAAPSQIPDNTFSFGFAATGYATPNNFRYNNGDVIAQSNSSSGVTQYTISYLFNIKSSTAAGLYTFAQSVVAVSTF